MSIVTNSLHLVKVENKNIIALTVSLVAPDLNRHCSASQQHQREWRHRGVVNILAVHICSSRYKSRYNLRRRAPHTCSNECKNIITIHYKKSVLCYPNRIHSECKGVSPSLFLAFAFAPFASKVDTMAATFFEVHTWMALCNTVLPAYRSSSSVHRQYCNRSSRMLFTGMISSVDIGT